MSEEPEQGVTVACAVAVTFIFYTEKRGKFHKRPPCIYNKTKAILLHILVPRLRTYQKLFKLKSLVENKLVWKPMKMGFSTGMFCYHLWLLYIHDQNYLSCNGSSHSHAFNWRENLRNTPVSIWNVCQARQESPSLSASGALWVQFPSESGICRNKMKISFFLRWDNVRN